MMYRLPAHVVVEVLTVQPTWLLPEGLANADSWSITTCTQAISTVSAELQKKEESRHHAMLILRQTLRCFVRWQALVQAGVDASAAWQSAYTVTQTKQNRKCLHTVANVTIPIVNCFQPPGHWHDHLQLYTRQETCFCAY